MAMRATRALGRLDLGEVQRQALAEAADAMAAAARANAPAGERIGMTTDSGSAVVGTGAAAAVAREFGRPGRPPERGLGRIGATHGPDAARRVGAAVAAAISDALGRR